MPVEAPGSGTSRPLIALFDRVADSYDRVGPPLFAVFAERLARAARVGEARRVLDLATGRGAVLLAAAAETGPRAQLVGVDLSTGMLRQAAAEVGRRSDPRLGLARMDASALAFRAGTFDRVLCGFALDLCPAPGAVVSEGLRVLEPGGLMAATVWAADCPHFLWLASALDACQSQLRIRARPATSGVQTESGLLRLLQRGGLADVRVRKLERTIIYTDPEEWWESLWTHCPRRILERFHCATLTEVKPRLLERAGQIARRGGIAAELRAFLALGRRPPDGAGRTGGSHGGL